MSALADPNIRKHYEDHLGNFYDWSIGDFSERCNEQKAYFQRKNILPSANHVAIDLGCGSGIQAVPLADEGFIVKAVDFNDALLTKLKERKDNRSIDIVVGDMMSLQDITPPSSVELVVCMGDTIAHLESFDQLKNLFAQALSSLVHGGKFVISYRDYSFELQGPARFIPVKSDDHRIHTCFLEYTNDFVMVTDQLYERENVDGKWVQKVSSYRKLRLTKEIVTSALVEAGFRIGDTDVINRVIYTVCEKP